MQKLIKRLRSSARRESYFKDDIKKQLDYKAADAIEFLQARINELEQGEPVRHEFQAEDGTWHPFLDAKHHANTVADGRWPIRALYAHPAKQPLTDKRIDCLFQANKTEICALPGGSAHVQEYRRFLVRMIEAEHGIGSPAMSSTPAYYLQDTRGYVGNCPLWWGPNGNGYTTDLRKAHRYTLAEAFAQHRSRDSDIPWLCQEIDAIQRPTVDSQDMPRDNKTQREAIELAHGTGAQP
jgi:hypothetical protein